jgi:hypothetical protein
VAVVVAVVAVAVVVAVGPNSSRWSLILSFFSTSRLGTTPLESSSGHVQFPSNFAPPQSQFTMA